MAEPSLKPPRFYSVKEVAAELGVHPDSVRKAITLGQLPVRRVGGQLRIPRKAFRLWGKHAPCEIRGEPVACTRPATDDITFTWPLPPATSAGGARRRRR